MNLEFGNAANLDTEKTGWIIGFSDWTKSDKEAGINLRHVPLNSDISNICVKWMHHLAGEFSLTNKPISTGRTISILVNDSGAFRLTFSVNPNFQDATDESFVLKKRGDFVMWGDGVYHKAKTEKDSTILTIRWA